MTLKKFEEFEARGIVKRQMPNKKRAVSLIEESEKKKEFLELLMKTIPFEKMSPNFIVESCYDIILELIRAKMFLGGYNSGNSHEAEVVYMLKLGFNESEVRIMDELRYFRNGIKYYGTLLNKEYAEKTLNFMNSILPKLKKLIKKEKSKKK